MCDSKKQRFIKEQEVIELLSCLEIKTSLDKSLVFSLILFWRY